MAEAENGQERTEEPTPKRLREAREKGQIPRSRELSTMAVMLAGAGGLLLFGGVMGQKISAMMASHLRYERAQLFDTRALAANLAEAIQQALLGIAPLLVTLTVVALLAPAALGGFSFSTQSMAPKLSKLNPGKGLKRAFGPQGLMEMFKAIAKFVVVFAVALVVLWAMADHLLSVGQQPITSALTNSAEMFGWVFLAMASALIVIAAVDVPFQIWNHTRQLRMTRQEVKDEQKETEGKPEVRGRVRELQREMAQRRMMAEVPTADVVVTNPTHYAVALRYDESTMGAPRVVAKGADLIAGQIRSMARQYEVPLLSAPSLARALYHSTEVDREVPVGLYVAVAQVLAYVYQVKAARREGWTPPEPPEPEVPDGYVPDDE